MVLVKEHEHSKKEREKEKILFGNIIKLTKRLSEIKPTFSDS